jgi:hypothetical protein
MRVVLQHPGRQVAADRFEHVVGDAHLCELGNDRVPQIVDPQAVRPAPARSARQAASRCSIGRAGS